MARRIEIELTSARPDGTWTWRAAGAREPKGVLDGKLLHEGAKTGDVLKAEAEFELEGIVITSVAAPKAETKSEVQRIEIVGPSRPEGPGVTTQLVGRHERRDRRWDGDEDRRRERGPGRPRTEGGRPRREGGPAAGGPDRGRRPAAGESGEHRAGREGGRREVSGREGGGRREGTGREATGREGGGRREVTGREGGRREGREGAGARPPRPEGERRPAGATRTSSQAERGDRGKARRLSPGSAHRKAVMEALPPEQQPIAEHLLRGGIPAVRTALHLEREKAEAEGRPAPNSDALLALAESLLPRLRAAEWRDRAEAAVSALDHISMRDLRSIVAGADQARDEESRKLASTLREAIDTKVAKLHSDWTADITSQLDAGRVVRAVRLSARPPDAAARLEPELSTRLAEAASAMMSPETSPDLWVALLEALAESPVRRSVSPSGLPANPPPELDRAVHLYAGHIPALAKLLGMAIPPPPSPVARKRPAERHAAPKGPRRDGVPAGGGRRRDQPGAKPTAATEEAPPEAPAGEEHPPSDAEQATTEAAVEAAQTEQPAAESAVEAAESAVEAAQTEQPAAEAPAEAAQTEQPAGEQPDTEQAVTETPAGEEHLASDAEQAATEAAVVTESEQAEQPAAEQVATEEAPAQETGADDGEVENPSPS